MTVGFIVPYWIVPSGWGVIKTENDKSSEVILKEIIDKKIWSNAEIRWLLNK